jgi:hypothetical protein
MPSMGRDVVVMLGIGTAHGHYDVLPARPEDGDVPVGATHSVYHEDGSLAGFASDSTAWEFGDDAADVIGRASSLEQAARMVAAVDGELLGFSADGTDFRGVDA